MDWYGAARALMAEHEAEIARLKDHLAAGNCGTMDEYRQAVGEVRGHEKAIRMIRERLSDEEKQALGIPPTGRAGSPTKRKG